MRPVKTQFSKVVFSTAVLVAVFVCVANAKPAGNAKPAENAKPAVNAKPARTSRLAKYTSLCKLKDPQLNQCITNAMTNILKYSKTGIPELNIPAFEPFIIPEIDLKVFRGLSSSFFGGSIQRSDKHRAFARNLTIHHSSEYILNDLKIDIEKRVFNVDLNFPQLQMEGEYDVNLVIFNLPIKSTGPVFINSTDTSVKATLNGKTIKRKNESFLLFDSVDIKVDFKDYSIIIENLFKKEQNLNKALNDMLMNQKDELRKLTMPMIEELAGKMILSMINQIMSGLSIEEMFITE